MVQRRSRGRGTAATALRERENVDYPDAGAVIRAAKLGCVETGLDRDHESRLRIIRGLQSGLGDLGLVRDFPVIVRLNGGAIAIPKSLVPAVAVTLMLTLMGSVYLPVNWFAA